ncbi:hypothetical protein OEZ86_002365 [Tetradesmus obliquus]|nr:hypothetical protein OEZ86_002365 [Tetradesmus obliquus]
MQQQQQQQQVELIAPLMYVPRHRAVDAAVSGKPSSPMWNQMHVAQRRLHELQQEQQAILGAVRRSISPEPRQQPQQQQQQQQQQQAPASPPQPQQQQAAVQQDQAMQGLKT